WRDLIPRPNGQNHVYLLMRIRTQSGKTYWLAVPTTINRTSLGITLRQQQPTLELQSSNLVDTFGSRLLKLGPVFDAVKRSATEPELGPVEVLLSVDVQREFLGRPNATEPASESRKLEPQTFHALLKFYNLLDAWKKKLIRLTVEDFPITRILQHIP